MTEDHLEKLDKIEGRDPKGRVVSITTNQPFNMNGDHSDDFKKDSKWNLFPDNENCFSC